MAQPNAQIVPQHAVIAAPGIIRVRRNLAIQIQHTNAPDQDAEQSALLFENGRGKMEIDLGILQIVTRFVKAGAPRARAPKVRRSQIIAPQQHIGRSQDDCAAMIGHRQHIVLLHDLRVLQFEQRRRAPGGILRRLRKRHHAGVKHEQLHIGKDPVQHRVNHLGGATRALEILRAGGGEQVGAINRLAVPTRQHDHH